MARDGNPRSPSASRHLRDHDHSDSSSFTVFYNIQRVLNIGKHTNITNNNNT